MGKQRDLMEHHISDKRLSDEFAERYFAGERFVDWRPIVGEVERKCQELKSQRELLQSADIEETTGSRKDTISVLALEIKALENDVLRARGFVRSAEGALTFAITEGDKHDSLFESIRCRTIAMFAQTILDSAAPILALEKAQKAVLLPSPRDTAACEATPLTCRRKSFLERRKKNDCQSSQDQSNTCDDTSTQQTSVDIRKTSPFEVGMLFESKNAPLMSDGLSWSSIAAMFNPVSDMLCSPFDPYALDNKLNAGTDEPTSVHELQQIETDTLEKQRPIKCDTFENTKTVESFEAELPACTLPKNKATLTDWDPGFEELQWPEHDRSSNLHQRKLSDFSWGEFEKGTDGPEKKSISLRRQVPGNTDAQQSEDEELGFIDEPYEVNVSKDSSDDSPYERINSSSPRDDSLVRREELSYTARDYTSYSASVHTTLQTEEPEIVVLRPFEKRPGIILTQQNFQITPLQSGRFDHARFEEFGEI